MSRIRQLFKWPLTKKLLIAQTKRVVFVYHDISDPTSPHYSTDYSTTIKNFSDQVDYLGRHFEFVTLETIVSSSYINRNRIASITFDDGFKSVVDVAMPVLASKNIPFSLFVNKMAVETDRLSYSKDDCIALDGARRRTYMTCDDIGALAKDGVCIGSHAKSHRILSACDDESLLREIAENKEYLEELCKNEIEHFAIPFGKREHYDNRILKICNLVGHRYIYSTNPVPFDADHLIGPPYVVPRIGLTEASPSHINFLLNRSLVKRIDI